MFTYFKRSIVRKLILLLAATVFIVTFALVFTSYQREKEVYFENVDTIAWILHSQIELEMATVGKLSRLSAENGTPADEDFRMIEQKLSAVTKRHPILNAYLYDTVPKEADGKTSLKLLAVSESLRNIGIDHFSYYELPAILKNELESLRESDIITTVPYSDADGTYVSSIIRLKDGSGNSVALLGIDLDYKSVQSHLNATLWTIILIGFGISIVLFIAAFFLLRQQLSPLSEITAATKLAAQGDMTIQMDVARMDEFALLKQHFNEMIRQIGLLVSGIKTASVQVEKSAIQLHEGAEQTVKAAGDVATSTHELASGTESQLQSIEETKRAVEEMAKGMQRIAESAGVINDTVSSVAAEAANGNQVVDKASVQMNAIKDNVHGSNEHLQRLLKQSNEIAQIVTVIAEIANQTNLLSLNASIEAARAGEYGRGFNVVAMEIRTLAEQSKQSAQNIAGIIEAVQKIVQQTADSIVQSEKEVDYGAELMADVSRTFHSIAGSMADVHAQVQETSASTEQISASVEQINATMDELAKISEMSSSGAQTVAAATEEQLATMDEMTNNSLLLTETAKAVQEQAAKFKVN